MENVENQTTEIDMYSFAPTSLCYMNSLLIESYVDANKEYQVKKASPNYLKKLLDYLKSIFFEYIYPIWGSVEL